MKPRNLLFNVTGSAMTPHQIRETVKQFYPSYKAATQEIIQHSSAALDEAVFIRCTARILSSFGMTRAGFFHGVGVVENGNVHGREILLRCWNEIGHDLIAIRKSMANSGYPRDRYLLQLTEPELNTLTAEIWLLTKRLLPLTMGKTSHGLVGASKILFAVLPEVVLPVDNIQWLKVFYTVDLGDVINRMASDITAWEHITQHRLNEMDPDGTLTTLPAVYNVMAMNARPRG